MRLGISILNISIFINTQHIYKNAMKEPRKEQSNTIVTTDPLGGEGGCDENLK
jgi:hypothetical protein